MLNQSAPAAPTLRLVRDRDRLAREALPERLAVRVHAYGRAYHPTQIARLLGVQMREVYRALAGDPVLASTRAAIDSKL